MTNEKRKPLRHARLEIPDPNGGSPIYVAKKIYEKIMGLRDITVTKIEVIGRKLCINYNHIPFDAGGGTFVLTRKTAKKEKCKKWQLKTQIQKLSQGK